MIGGVPLNFDANSVEPRTAPTPLPNGWYDVVITNSEPKQTKDQTGSYLELTMKVISGQFQGRTVKDRLNLNNQNPVAVEIAYKTLSSICRATGVMQVQSSAQLHNIPFQCRVAVTPAQNGYDEGNDVKDYRSVAQGAAAQGTFAPGQPANGQPPAPTFAPPAGPPPPPPPPPAPAPAPAPAPFAPPGYAPPQPAQAPQPQQPPAPAPQQFAPQQFAPPPQQFAPPAAPAPQFAPPPPPAPGAAGAPPPWER